MKKKEGKHSRQEGDKQEQDNKRKENRKGK